MITDAPFLRGSFTVGVQTADLNVSRKLRLELWYPATEKYRNQDMEGNLQDRYFIVRGEHSSKSSQSAVRNVTPIDKKFPMIIYSHGGYSHRRSASYLCTHLASHGYVVVGVDHSGNTIHDQFDVSSDAGNVESDAEQSMEDRPNDISSIIDAVVEGQHTIFSMVNTHEIGLAGISFGGWTALAALNADSRVTTAMAINPAWGECNPYLENIFSFRRLSELLPIMRPAPVLVLSGRADALARIADVKRLYERLLLPKMLVIVENAGHVHFGDAVEENHVRLASMFSQPGQKSLEQDRLDLLNDMQQISVLADPKHTQLCAMATAVFHFDRYLKRKTVFHPMDVDCLRAGFESKNLHLEIISD